MTQNLPHEHAYYVIIHSEWYIYKLFWALCALWNFFFFPYVLMALSLGLGLGDFPNCICRSGLGQWLKGTLFRSLELSFYVCLPSSLFCPVNSARLNLSRFWTLFSPISETAVLYFVSLSLHWHWQLFRQWAETFSGLIFCSCRDHWPALLVVQCLKTVVLCIFLVEFSNWLRQERKFSLVSPSWLKARCHPLAL